LYYILNPILHRITVQTVQQFNHFTKVTSIQQTGRTKAKFSCFEFSASPCESCASRRFVASVRIDHPCTEFAVGLWQQQHEMMHCNCVTVHTTVKNVSRFVTYYSASAVFSE